MSTPKEALATTTDIGEAQEGLRNDTAGPQSFNRREDGRLPILPSAEAEEAGALSGRTPVNPF